MGVLSGSARNSAPGVGTTVKVVTVQILAGVYGDAAP